MRRHIHSKYMILPLPVTLLVSILITCPLIQQPSPGTTMHPDPHARVVRPQPLAMAITTIPRSSRTHTPSPQEMARTSVFLTYSYSAGFAFLKAWYGRGEGLPGVRQLRKGRTEQYLQRHQGQDFGLPSEGSRYRISAKPGDETKTLGTTQREGLFF